MAISTEGGFIRGKMNGKVYRVMNGKQYVKRAAKKVHVPRTEAQKRHWAAFGALARLSADMKEASLIGLHPIAKRRDVKEFSVFRKMNKDYVDADKVNYARLMLSYGSVTLPWFEEAKLVDGRVLTVNFEEGGGNSDDKVFVFVYCPEKRMSGMTMNVRRSDRKAELELPEEWSGCAVHVYGFVKESSRKVSMTKYLGQVTLP